MEIDQGAIAVAGRALQALRVGIGVPPFLREPGEGDRLGLAPSLSVDVGKAGAELGFSLSPRPPVLLPPEGLLSNVLARGEEVELEEERGADAGERVLNLADSLL